MQRVGPVVVKDPLHGSIDLTLFEKELLNHYMVDRLSSIKQLASVYKVFPGATHSRLAHSIGTMAVATEIFQYSLANASAAPSPHNSKNRARFYLECKRESLINGIVALKRKYAQHAGECQNLSLTLENSINFLSTPEKYAGGLLSIYGETFWRKHIGNPSPAKRENIIHALLLQTLRIASLLHDVGHLAYSHITEFALEPPGGRRHRKPLHESVGKIASAVLLQEVTNEFKHRRLWEKNTLRKNYDITIDTLFVLLTHFDNLLYELHGTILSARGGLDADRIDYVARDGTFTGMLQSTGDLERIVKFHTLQLLDPQRNEENEVITQLYGKRGREYTEKCGDHSSEFVFAFLPTTHIYHDAVQILMDRYRLSRYVNNHHRVRRLDGVMERAVSLLVKDTAGDLQDDEKLLDHELKKLESTGDSYIEKQTRNLEKSFQAWWRITRDFRGIHRAIERLHTAGEQTELNLRKILACPEGGETLLQEDLQEFYKFTDDWLLSNLVFLHASLNKIDLDSISRCIERGQCRVEDWFRRAISELDELKIMLDELLSRRSYISIWKRDSDYFEFVESYIEDVNNAKQIIEGLAMMADSKIVNLKNQHNKVAISEALRNFLFLYWTSISSRGALEKLENEIASKTKSARKSIFIARITVKIPTSPSSRFIFVSADHRPKPNNAAYHFAERFGSPICFIQKTELRGTLPFYLFVAPTLLEDKTRKVVAHIAIEAAFELATSKLELSSAEERKELQKTAQGILRECGLL